MRAATILGAGELGTACALALAADGVAAVRLLTRDVALASSDRGAVPASASSFQTPTSAPWPSAVRLCDVSKDFREGGDVSACGEQPYFLCSPVTSYLSPDDAWAKAALGIEHSPVTHDMLKRWRRTAAAPAAAQPTHSTPFVCAFTRGFSADGGVPAQLVDELLNGSVGDASSCATTSDIPVLVGAGPVLAKEWAVQCTPTQHIGSGAAVSAPSSSSIPPRPRSALCDDAGGEEAELPAKDAETSAASALTYAHAFSGVSLAFAAWTPSVQADAGKQAALAAALKGFFRRESVTYLHEADAAAVLSIVNGCVPLCSFGAGLVSGVYAGTSVTALASYAQHAASATEQLVNDLLGRPAGTPLPIAAWSTLHCACTSLASREFAFGRQLDFYFRKQDAVQAIFRGRTHHVFAATVDGLHTRMQTGGIVNPFYEVLMDTYNTMIRASRAGEGLVKAGYYDYRGATKGEGVLLQHAMQVDEAMLSGEEDRFAAAKERLVKAFPGALMH